MTKIHTYTNTEFGDVRTMIGKDGEPWFIGKDIAAILGYERPAKAIQDHVDIDDRDAVPIQDSIGRMQNTPIINESGLYSLILSSKLPTAKKFKKWVTSEVLPSIRKNGAYISGQENMDAEQLIAKALVAAQKIIDDKEKQIEQKDDHIRELEPKARFADAVNASDTSILIGELAKILRQNGYKIGQNRLFEELRQQGYLCSRGSMRNIPTQKSMDLGLFEIKERTIDNPDGSVRTVKTTKVTGKGQQYFINKFLA